MTAGWQNGRAAALLAGLLLVITPIAAQDEVGIPRGSVPDAVSVDDLDGNAVDLGRWIGQGPALFEFWATWCENCAAMAPRLAALHQRFGDRVAFVAIGVGVNQNPRSIRRHLERHPVPWPTLFDRRGRATRAFSAPVTSYIVVLDREGKVVYTGSGPDQDLGPVLERVAEASR